MKKIWILFILLCAIQCSETGTDTSSDDSYVNVDFLTDLTVNSSKAYSFDHSSMSASCGPAASCAAP